LAPFFYQFKKILIFSPYFARKKRVLLLSEFLVLKQFTAIGQAELLIHLAEFGQPTKSLSGPRCLKEKAETTTDMA
jgi:hypothetical protein